MKNAGKQFEEDIRKSIPTYCLVHRLKDSAQSYNTNINTKFAWNNGCDFLVFDSKKHILYAIECKSTKYKSMGFQAAGNDTGTKMVKYHQIKYLTELSSYDGIVPCFLLNFRDEGSSIQRTYFIHIKDFNALIRSSNKKSFNEMDLILNGARKIKGTKKRVRYGWDMDSLFSEMEV